MPSPDCRYRKTDGTIFTAKCSIAEGDDASDKMEALKLEELLGNADELDASGNRYDPDPGEGGGASEREFIGTGPNGELIWNISDPDDPLATGFYVQRHGASGQFLVPATDSQAAFATGTGRFTAGTGSGQPAADFTQTYVDGVGLVAFNKRTGKAKLAVPAPGIPIADQLEVERGTGNLLVIRQGPNGGVRVINTHQRIGQPQFSPEQLRQQDLADFQSQQRAQIGATAQQQGFQAQESAAARAFTGQESAAARAFTGQENALSRAQRAAEFAATHGINQRDQALGGATQLSNLISNVDPAAFEAFAAGGGFNIANAIAGGGDALSTNALLPAARTLRALEGFQEAPPPHIEPSPFAIANQRLLAEQEVGKDLTLIPGTPRYEEAVQRARQRILDAAARGSGIGGTLIDHDPASTNFGGPTPWAIAEQQLIAEGLFYEDRFGGLRPVARAQSMVGENPLLAPAISARAHSMVGENPLLALRMAAEEQDQIRAFEQEGRPAISARAHSMVGENPLLALRMAAEEQDQIRAFEQEGRPVISAAHGFSGVVNTPTTFQVAENGPEHVQVTPGSPAATPEDDPFLERIRKIRERTQVPNLLPGGSFNVGFANLPPTLQDRFFAARQSRFGIPIADQLAEARRFQLQGAGRSFGFGL